MKPVARVRPDGAQTVHGGVDPAELAQFGLRPDQVLDFSSNLNPFGPSSAVRLAAQNAAIERYPDPGCDELRRELARRHGVTVDEVLVGNGSSELIWLAAVAYLSHGDNVAVLGPAFGEYERSATMMGANVATCSATAKDDFSPPLGDFGMVLSQRPYKLAFLASPNNPTGQVMNVDLVHDLADRHRGSLFVLDEVYSACLACEGQANVKSPVNVLRLRSLTKAHGLAGVRLGYALGHREIIAALRAVQPPWSVNAVAQAAGLTALAEERHLQNELRIWTDAKMTLTHLLSREGFTPVPSATPFFLLPVGNAKQVRVLLLRRGLLVRDCTSFGLPEYIRICARRPHENATLVEALVEVRAGTKSCRA